MTGFFIRSHPWRYSTTLVNKFSSVLKCFQLTEQGQQLDLGTDFKSFFTQAPTTNTNIVLIKGVVCGARVEEVADPLMQKIRYLDKLIDELAKGKSMEKILRCHRQLMCFYQPVFLCVTAGRLSCIAAEGGAECAGGLISGAVCHFG